jgi:NAD(P)H-dependent flavin oxidoreductase YrpB (nitropropane dioxygenase family)
VEPDPVADPGPPTIIQGGMGVGVSGWRLARAVSRTGQLGVVSGVALDITLARRLQLGDPGGHLRRALARFPAPGIAERVLDRYLVPGGIAPGKPFRPVPRLGLRPSRHRTELTVAANFAEVFLAKEGHRGVVGVNYLEKVQLATPAAVYGAMLAGVDYVLMGAGIPVEIPALLDAFAAHATGEVAVTVVGAGSEERHAVALDPAELLGDRSAARPARPRFLAVVSSHVLAEFLTRNGQSGPDGFVLESAVAGGHSAPPRGKLRLDEHQEPVYGPRDAVDLDRVAATGRPFWLAGGQATPRARAASLAAGAAGIQVGTAFALCRESGLDAGLRRAMFAQASQGSLSVRNDAYASPAGFPFKVAQMAGTVSDEAVYADRARRCDLGYLRTPYRRDNGAVGYRCAAEPVAEYRRKGGDAADTDGRRCLCNGLVASVGLGQRRADGYLEPALLTLGQDLDFLPELVSRAGTDYRAADVVDYLLHG